MSMTPAARQSSTSLVTSLLTILWTGQSPAQHSTVHYSTLQYSTLQYSTSMVTSLLTILRTVQSCHVTITRH